MTPDTVTADPGEPAVYAQLNLAAITHKPTRDALRRAAAEARHGPVWIVNRAGKRIGAIVTPGDAAFLREIRRGLHEAETGQTVALGSFAEHAAD